MGKKIFTVLPSKLFNVHPLYYIVAVSSVAVKKAGAVDEESDDEGQLRRKARPSRKSATGNKIFNLFFPTCHKLSSAPLICLFS